MSLCVCLSEREREREREKRTAKMKEEGERDGRERKRKRDREREREREKEKKRVRERWCAYSPGPYLSICKLEYNLICSIPSNSSTISYIRTVAGLAIQTSDTFVDR